MEPSVVEISHKTVLPYTLVYLRTTREVLLIKKPVDRWGNPERWLGLGGKVEPGEDIQSSAAREIREESGLVVPSLTLRGTFTYIHENRAGTLYIFVATEYRGELLKQTTEGILRWHRISEVPTLEKLADHQNHFLHRILSDDSYFYCGIAAYNGMQFVQYSDSDLYFAERSAEQSLAAVPHGRPNVGTPE